MTMMKKLARHLGRGARSLYVVFGVILIWRGVWVLLDWIDIQLFGEITIGLALLGILIGLFLLFKHDHKLDELGHL